MNFLFKKIMSLWSLMIIVAYPVIFLYGQNVNEIAIGEIIAPIAMLELFLGLILFINLLILRHFERASLITFFVIIFANYFSLFLTAIQMIIPAAKYWHMCTIFVMVWGALLLLNKKISDDTVRLGLIGICILANVYAVINLVPIAVNYLQNTNPHRELNDTTKNTADRGMPNIYYLVFDEYSSNEFMKKYYDYDNSAVTDELERLGFNISHTSKNEAYMTEICMTNIMNLDYIFDMSDEEDDSMSSVITAKRKDNLLFQLLTEHEYEIQAIGNAEFYGLEDASNAASLESTSFDGKSFNEIVFKNTIFSPFIKQNTSMKLESLIKNREYIKQLHLPPNSGNFVLFHVELPHTAFVVDKNGNPINAENRLNWENKKYYLEQYQYASNMMLDIATQLVEWDENSIIVICSDHSARGREEFSEIDKCQIFNNVYFQGKDFDIEGLSGINTLRKILNNLFELNFEMLQTIPLEYKRDNDA